jgi:glycosyltransferase involved in cell wall biosynthesis
MKLEKADPAIIEFSGQVSDVKLRDLLARAALLVQPSLYEGFGAPPLEAMFCGTRVLISDIPVFKEIYTDFPVIFFRVGDSDDLKNKLLVLLKNKEPETIELSESLKNKYSFQKVASTILNTIEKR